MIYKNMYKLINIDMCITIILFLVVSFEIYIIWDYFLIRKLLKRWIYLILTIKNICLRNWYWKTFFFKKKISYGKWSFIADHYNILIRSFPSKGILATLYVISCNVLLFLSEIGSRWVYWKQYWYTFRLQLSIRYGFQTNC